MEKIGLYGGTFAPPHLGHVHAARAFLRAIPVDRLLIMPTFQPPHKAKAAGDTPEVRLEMCRAAFGDIPGVEVSEYEIAKADVSYTVQTLRHLTAANREIYLLCGTDMFLTLEKWFCAEEIFRLARIVCVSRTADREQEIVETHARYRQLFGQDCILLSEAPLEVSSTQIRDAIREGRSLAAYVPPAVEAILRRDGLDKGPEK